MTKEEVLKKQEESFWNSQLDEEEQWYESRSDEFVPAPEWVGERLREAAKKPPVVHHAKKTEKLVSVRADVRVSQD